MIHVGPAFKLSRRNDILELCFDTEAARVNVFNRTALADLSDVLDKIEAEDSVLGLLMSSTKQVFVAGADITEFLSYFMAPDNELKSMLNRVNGLFNRIEALPFPTVACINGEAQGGGFEYALAADFRVAGPAARVGLPEVKLGIMPGWGGSVRLSRLIGIDNALDWMCTGASKKPAEALAHGAVDAVIEKGTLVDAATALIQRCHITDSAADSNEERQPSASRIDFRRQRAKKTQPLPLVPVELALSIESARAVVSAKAGPHYPSPPLIVQTVAEHSGLPFNDALQVEGVSFVKLAKTDVAASLVSIFLNDQALKRLARQQSAAARPVKQAAVLGAGIMGGGVAYQSASNQIPILMKDIRQDALDAGMQEASKLLKKQVERGKLDISGASAVLNGIRPALSYGEFDGVDLVVEAVVENPDVKQSVLADVEAQVSDDTILATNTSTISVNLLASGLQRPHNFCGMHFFNPVHRMPLVEVIRSETSSEAAIATTVAYAQAMRKTPIVVNDCPGFLVNRILFAYFAGFNRLVADGVSPYEADRALERFGMPMGPAFLLDVVGMDTARHAAAVIAAGFPDRMGSETKTVIDVMFDAERFGQKNGRGFYQHQPDKRGWLQKHRDAEAETVIAQVHHQGAISCEADVIVERLMIPMCIEAARCLDDDIVGTAAEVDMGLVYGIGFPPFRGGALRYMDQQGLAAFCDRADHYAHLGPLYKPTEGMRAMAATGATFHDNAATQPGARV